MNLSTQPYKGARDFYPEDKRLQNWIFSIWREACEQFGYEEYSGPTLEPLELYTAKTSEEIVNQQTYSFTDRGDRKIVMRPEMTPTVSRMVAARRQEAAYPLRLYSIANFFRYEQPQKGREREFWQLNADLFGLEGIDADFEIIQLADHVMKSLGAKPVMYEFRINSRQLLNKRIEMAGLKDANNLNEVVGLIDKKGKLDQGEFNRRLSEHVQNPSQLIDYINKDGATHDYAILEKKLSKLGITNVRFDGYLARGFNYYTDFVFEVFDTDPANNRSMFGGGRYDGLVGEFGVEPIPTVGFAMGDVTLLDFLKSWKLLDELKTTTDVRVIIVGDCYEPAQRSVSELRSMGLNVAVDFSSRKLDVQLKHAAKSGTRYVLFIGKDELANGEFKLRDLRKGEEKSLSLDQIASTLSAA
jgi:histidyl-tRNA synthetase